MSVKECVEQIKKTACQINGKAVIEEEILMRLISDFLLSPEQLDKLYDELTNNNINIVDDIKGFNYEDEQVRFAGELCFSLQTSVSELIDYYNGDESTDKSRVVVDHSINLIRDLLNDIRGSKPMRTQASLTDRFVFTNECIGYKKAVGYKVYDDSGRNVGVVFSEDDNRVEHYEHATINFYSKYDQDFGVWRRLKINGERLLFAKLKETLEKEGKFECVVDAKNSKTNHPTGISKGKITFEMTTVCYQYGKRLFENIISLNVAADEVAERTGMNRASAWMYIDSIRSMLSGTIFKRAMSQLAYEYALENIYKDFGKEKLIAAINATEQHLRYLSKVSGSTQKGSFQVCEKMRQKYCNN